MPGVLIVEAMAQVAGVLVLKQIPDRKKKLVLLATVEQAKFRSPVRPGDQLRMEMKVLRAQGDHGKDERHGDRRWRSWSPRRTSCASSPTRARRSGSG